MELIERFLDALENIAASLAQIANSKSSNKDLTPVGATSRQAMPAAEAAAEEDLLDTGIAATPEVKKPGRPAGAKKTAPAPVNAPDPAPQPAKPITIVEITNVVQQVIAQSHESRAKVITVLDSFGAKRISEMKQEQLPAAMAKMQVLLEAVKQAKK